jgi:hypothetical protein
MTGLARAGSLVILRSLVAFLTLFSRASFGSYLTCAFEPVLPPAGVDFSSASTSSSPSPSSYTINTTNTIPDTKAESTEEDGKESAIDFNNLIIKKT